MGGPDPVQSSGRGSTAIAGVIKRTIPARNHAAVAAKDIGPVNSNLSTYNQEDVTASLPFRTSRIFCWANALILLVAALGIARSVSAQDSAADAGPSSGRILLVLPFDNLTAPAAQTGTDPAVQTTSPADGQVPVAANEQTNLDWLREAAPEILNSRFTSAGFQPLTREDRLYALDHLGLPETFQPSRATALRIAETLDADYILIGNYRADGPTLTLKARIVDVRKLKLSDEVTESGPIAQLIPLLNSLAWQLTRQLDPSFSVAEETFRAAGSNLRLDAFEQYIRGLTELDATERLRHLKKATDLSPDFSAAWLATGKLQFANQQYEQAAVSFAKVIDPANGSDPAELEAGFYRGLALIFSGNYPRAEEAFATVARVLPLPEVVNNEAVAASRRGHDAIALFRQAEAADPNDADYHFNLAVSLHSHGSKAEALTELAQSLKLHPNDSEAKAALAAWKSEPEFSPSKPQAGTAAGPVERIRRSYNGAAFRQASLMLEQVEEAHLATLPAADRAARLSKSAREKLNRGLLLEAERGFQAALAADANNADAKTGLAQVRERAGTIESTQK
jgi:tetratricopeptide (TPR) repeat protein